MRFMKKFAGPRLLLGLGLFCLACTGKNSDLLGSPDGGDTGTDDGGNQPPTCSRKATGGVLDVDITTITLNGSITVNGSALAERFGTVYLRNPAMGDSILLGQIGDPNYAAKDIVPGTYDVYYTWNSADTATPPMLPRNANARIRSGVALTRSQQLDIDIPTVQISGAITVNGAVPTDTFGSVYLKNVATGDSLLLGSVGAASYTTKQIVPGAYDVYYAWNTADATVPSPLPHNGNGKVRTVMLTSTQTFNVDIPAVTLNGSITVNGAVPPDTFGTVYLKNVATGDSLLLGNMGAANYTQKLVLPGAYDVYYTWSTADTTVPSPLPHNANGKVRTVMLTSTQTLNVDIPTVTLNGTITVDGVVPTDTNGTVYLKNVATGDSLLLGSLGAASYTQKQIIPGTYDIFYSWTSTDPTTPVIVPRNSNARVRNVNLTASQTLNVDLPTVALNGTITVDGAVPTERFGTVYLRYSATGDSLLLGNIGDAMYLEKRILPGVYEAYYTWNSTDTVNPPDLPRNANALIKVNLDLQHSQTLNLDITGIMLSGSVKVSGSTPVDRFGSVYLRASAIGDSLTLGNTGDAMYLPKRVVPSIYDIVYSWNSTDTNAPPSIPRNSSAVLGCIEIVP